MTTSTATKTLQERAVHAAAKFLERKNCTIVETDWECPQGSADLIAQDEGTLVFVQVNSRAADQGWLPEEDCSVTSRRRLEKVAASYLSNADFIDVAVRFDAISILVFDEERAFLRHHIDAFSAC